MNGTRQQIQYSLALEQADQGEAPVSGHQRTEPFVAKPAPESSAVTEQLMEEVCNRENLVRAWKRVRQNKGGPGVDGMTIDDAKDYLREHWPSIRSQLLAGTYQPQPVKRVEIPKPDGGVRKLGVPCVVDRLAKFLGHEQSARTPLLTSPVPHVQRRIDAAMILAGPTSTAATAARRSRRRARPPSRAKVATAKATA